MLMIPVWHSGLSDLASKQRQAAQARSSSSHDYLSESASVSRWKDSIFSGNAHLLLLLQVQNHRLPPQKCGKHLWQVQKEGAILL